MAQPHTQQSAPPTRPSDEATEQQLRLAKQQGDAFGAAIREMTQHEARGASKRAGDYMIGWAAEEAEGMYHARDGGLQWEGPGDANCHIEVVVCDAVDGRFIPGLTVKATLIDQNGSEVGTHEQPFIWHPWLYHYGRNWKVPGDGTYRLRVHIDAPEFMRHDRTNGRRYTDPVDIEFERVEIRTGRKESPPPK